MKRAAVYAIAALAKEDIPDEVQRVTRGWDTMLSGVNILFRSRTIRVAMRVAPAVAEAAIESGVARNKIDIKRYREEIEGLLGPTRRIIAQSRRRIVAAQIKRRPVVVLPYGHELTVLRAANQIVSEGVQDVMLLGDRTEIARMRKCLDSRILTRRW